MQTKKEAIKNKILESAKKEFFEKGFKEASMRCIAKQAGVSTSNIYNYYTDKNTLFDDVLKPLIHKFSQMEQEHNDPKYIDLDVFESKKYKDRHIALYIELITSYREELKLLLFHSYGSKYQNFREDFTDKQTIMGREYLEILKKKYPQLNINISDFFMHTFSSWILAAIGELVFHNISDSSLKEILDNYFTFSIGGWKKLIQQ